MDFKTATHLTQGFKHRLKTSLFNKPITIYNYDDGDDDDDDDDYYYYYY